MERDIDRVLIGEQELADQVADMGNQIARAYTGSEGRITIVTILSGSIIFLADLIRVLPMKLRVDLVSVSSYRGKTKKPGSLMLLTERPLDVEGRDVLIVDDILDTGGTLRLVTAELRRGQPSSVKTAVLLRKPSKAPSDVKADFVGFDIEDEFVVGYGLDYDGMYRNLPYVAVLKPEVYGGQ